MFSTNFQQQCNCSSIIIIINSNWKVGFYRELEIIIAQCRDLAVFLETNKERNNYTGLSGL